MQYLAIPRPTIEWLLANPNYKDAVLAELDGICANPAIRKSVLVVNALRFAASRGNPNVLVMWNVEYMTATGAEEWGILRIAQPYGLLGQTLVEASVAIDRGLTVSSLRLSNLLLPEPYIHRGHEDNLHTCVAGGNSEARKFSLGFYDGSVAQGETRRPVVLVAGPWGGDSRRPENDIQPLLNHIRSEEPTLPALVASADQVIADSVRRPALESAHFATMQERFAPDSAKRTESPVASMPVLPPKELEAGVDVTRLSYSDWCKPESLLTPEQRRVLESDVIKTQPLRIMGPAGSGKSLLMQLLALRQLFAAQAAGAPCRILYLVHNNAMMNAMWGRFYQLGAEAFLSNDNPQTLNVQTLFTLSRNALKPDEVPVIDKDAHETKEFQRQVAADALTTVFETTELKREDHPILAQAVDNEELFEAITALLPVEIGVAIKGHGLIDDVRQYVQSEKPLSRLHGVLTQAERAVIYEAYRVYNEQIFEDAGLLDSDDLALTLLARLRTQLWRLKRKQQGYDFVFVDETQLFNENERRLIPLMTKRDTGNLPIALALDEAQDLSGRSSSGLGLLGIESIFDGQLQTVYRSTRSILKLAFHIIQRTTDLFDQVNFPDFTTSATTIVPDDHHLAAKPKLVIGGQPGTIGKYIVKRVQRLRKKNLRQVAVIVHAEHYWHDVVTQLQESRLPVLLLTKRGEKIDQDRPLVVVSRPSNVGGQEFDAVVAVGLENGIVPPRVQGHDGLAVALEQQALREIYLSFTRARYQLLIANGLQTTPSPLLTTALADGLIDRDNARS